MAWDIACTNCRGQWTTAENIVDLTNHLHPEGWFLCGHCNSRGYIKRRYKKRETGLFFWLFLRAMLRPSTSQQTDTYQPFAFLVGESPDDAPKDLLIWFCYYKDTRSEPGGDLRMGHGPGGPPVLEAAALIDLIAQMVKCRSLNPDDLTDALDKGHGPGGPPVFEPAALAALIDLITRLVKCGSVDPDDLTAAIDKARRKEP